MAALPPECRHEPTLALDGGADGIAIIARIIAEAGRASHRKRAACSARSAAAASGARARYPELPFLWLDTEDSEAEVFFVAAADLG